MSCDIGLYGLAVMGQNFALNMASHGFKVCVGNRSPAKVELTVNRAKDEGDLPIVGSSDVENFVQQLSKPRKIIILVMAGKPVDDTIAKLSQYLEEGDVIVDGGNEWFHNTLRRSKELEPKGIHFVGMGISGGEEGARNGPSLMPGGPKVAYDMIEPIITKCAAQVNDGPCTAYLGPVGAGNYVKMVHNGIEYGDMQLIGEVYDIMKNVLKMSNDEMATIFEEWNKTELESYLIEITSKILAKKDDVTNEGYVVDYILDKTGMKGTGRWTIQEAAERSVAAPTMAASLDARYISARKDERVKASTLLKGPEMTSSEIPVHKSQLLDDLKAALYAAKVCSYAQGLGIIKACSNDMDWNVNLSECARLWKGGCIIRAAFLQKILNAKKVQSISSIIMPSVRSSIIYPVLIIAIAASRSVAVVADVNIGERIAVSDNADSGDGVGSSMSSSSSDGAEPQIADDDGDRDPTYRGTKGGKSRHSPSHLHISGTDTFPHRERRMMCKDASDTLDCRCDMGGCNMDTCNQQCSCNGGSCSMMGCINGCTCMGGNCSGSSSGVSMSISLMTASIVVGASCLMMV